jgi:V/A-type H+-transporting ATPase subunit E
MNDVKALTGSILEQARAEADRILKAAGAEVENIRAEAQQKARERSEEIRNEYEHKIETMERRLQIEAELEGKKQVLAAKHGLIDEVFNQSRAALSGLPAEKRVDFLAKRLAAAGMEHGGEVKAVGARTEWLNIIKEANQLIAHSGKLSQLVFSGETSDIEGGFLLVGPGFTVDGSYRAILEEIKDEMIPVVAKYLFKSGKE